MSPVSMIVMPFNGRFDFEPEGSTAMLGEFVPLPIPMPQHVSAWTGHYGRPVALWCDDRRIHPRDFATVLRGVQQFNDDLGPQDDVPRSVTSEDEPGDDAKTLGTPGDAKPAVEIVADEDVLIWRNESF
jgi:hypothetical protein